MADIVVEENLQGVFVARIQKEQLASVGPLVSALPEGVVVPDCKSSVDSQMSTSVSTIP